MQVLFCFNLDDFVQIKWLTEIKTEYAKAEQLWQLQMETKFSLLILPLNL